MDSPSAFALIVHCMESYERKLAKISLTGDRSRTSLIIKFVRLKIIDLYFEILRY